jgi:anti-sigma B factor antagonist
LRCNLSSNRGQVRVHPVGELDIATAPDVARAIRQLYAAGFTRVILDLRELSFMDSAGVHMVIEAHRAAQRAGAELELVAGPPHVQRAFELTATAESLPFRLPTSLDVAFAPPRR